MDEANRTQANYKEALALVEAGQLTPADANVYRDARAKAWKRAIDGVLIAYEMAIPHPQSPDYARLPKKPFVHGKFEGQVREWVITFSDLPLGAHISERTDPKEFKRYDGHRKNALAITIPDGTTIVFKTDYKTPAELAFTLFHERSHYDQWADPAFKNSTISEREVASWKSGLENIEKFGFTPDELKAARKNAGKMLVQESLKAITSRGRRNVDLFGSWIRNALPLGEDDARQELDSSIEGVRVDAGLVAALREDAERINEEVAREAAERALLEVAQDACAGPSRLRYDDEFQARYRRVPVVSGEPRVVTSDPCAQEVFASLWRAKAQGLRNAQWQAIADAAESLGGNSGGGSGSVYGCSPSNGIPCPSPSRSVAAVPQMPIPAVAAQLPRPAQAAELWTKEGALNLLAAKGCADPWSFSQADLDRNWAGLLGMAYDGGMPARLGLQGCQERLSRSLMEMASQRLPATLSQEMFARTAEAARNPAPAYIVDDFPEVPGRQAPTVPTCRHHPWCQSWGQ
ncbi:MAG: hypothetical protein FD126_20 [Elusimicrobia bacterium]|nr:MAG: hypothetical protein FD126_20 [Elusimicrobiota bacterium]